MRVVFDTNTIVSALLFANGKLSWLRFHWAQQSSIPIVSQETVQELLRVLAYPKFKLTPEEQNELLADFLPFAETAAVDSREKFSLPKCRDKFDQKFLILAHKANVDFLVTGDSDLLVLNEQVRFEIISPSEFKRLFENY